MTREEAFWARVNKTDTCWLWTGATNTRYPVFSYGGRGNMGYAHRWSYSHFVGDIPGGFQIDHLCRNVLCVRPEHLEAVNHRVNMGRTKRPVCGKGHPMAGDNLWVGPTGARKCRTCRDARWAAWSPKRGYRHRHRRPELAEDCPQCRRSNAA